MARVDAFYESINVGRVRFFERSGEVWQGRALLWKELRIRASGKLRHATRIALGLLLVATLPLSGIWNIRDSIAFFVWVFPGLLVLQAVIGGVSLFVHEKEGRQWDVLLSTPLTSGQIVLSKLAGGLAPLLPTAFVFTLYATAIALFHANGATWWFLAVVPAGVFAIFAFVLSAAASMRADSHRAALGMSMGFLLGLLLGLPAVCEVMDFLPGWPVRVNDLLPLTSPVPYLSEAGEAWRWSGWYSSRDGDATALMVYFSLYGLSSVGLVAWMGTRFDRLAGRGPV
jgi:ABC-type transport system involved in multi-copper enzyme maturation permease subunit